MSSKFKDDKIIHVESDIRKIQIKPTVYISYGGVKGSCHLVKEAINNCIDECLNEASVGDTVYIYYDEDTDTVEVSDNGRGIPFEYLSMSCTLLQAGSKQSRENGGNSAGENGIGMTAINALCSSFTIISQRYGEVYMLVFRDGELISERKQKIKNDNHGLTIKMKPSTTFLGSDAGVDIDYMESWVHKISFLLPESIKIKFETKRKDQSKNVKKTFKNVDSLKGYLKAIVPDATLFRIPIVLSDHSTIMEKDVTVQQEDGTIASVSLMRDIELTVAINYNTDSTVFDPHSYCNFIENIAHGFHNIGVKQAFLTYIKKQFKDSLSKKESHYEIQDNDVLSGLSLVVNLNTTHSTGFSPQTKELLGNQALLAPIRSLASRMFTEYFKTVDGRKYIASIIKMIKFNIESRLSVAKARSKVKATASFLDERSIPGYTSPNNRKKGQYREIYLVEGESAGGSGRGGRYDNDVQGVLELRGKISNILKKAPHEAIKAEDIKKILDILKCGYDKHYSEEDLYFQKIIIFTDADVDGDHIAALILLLFIMRCPKLIENGHVYRAMTPLYKIKSKNSKKSQEDAKVNIQEYKYDKKEFFTLYEEYVSKSIKIKVKEDDKFSSPQQMAAFLAVNKEYHEILESIAGHYSCNRDIIEYMAIHIDNFKNNIKDLGNELSYHDDGICGVYDGHWNNILITEPVMKDLKKMNDIIHKYNNGVSHYYLYNSYSHANNVLRGYLTIGQIMQLCSTLEPPIATRYKGLGELDPKDLSELGFNPFNRKMIKITMDDAKETVNKFIMLFSNKQMDEKKRMYMDADISMEDLDN